MAKSGDICEECKRGQLYVYASSRSGNMQKRYLKCGNCGHTPGKEIALAETVRRRIDFTNGRTHAG